MNAHLQYGWQPPAMTGRVRRQSLARELYALREAQEEPTIRAIRRSLRGRS